MEDLCRKFVEFCKKQKLIIGIFLVGICSLGFGFFQLISSNHTDDIVIQRHTSSQSASMSAMTDSEAVVDIEGGVEKPGVYSVASDARIQDVVLKAGGFSESANQLVIAKQLNLAAKIKDGTKIYIPTTFDSNTNQSMGMSDSQVLGASTSVMNVNSADAAALDSLPGIGSVTAQKIISGRPYGDTSELVTKKVITQKVYDKLKDLITTY